MPRKRAQCNVLFDGSVKTWPLYLRFLTGGDRQGLLPGTHSCMLYCTRWLIHAGSRSGATLFRVGPRVSDNSSEAWPRTRLGTPEWRPSGGRVRGSAPCPPRCPGGVYCWCSVGSCVHLALWSRRCAYEQAPRSNVTGIDLGLCSRIGSGL